MYVDIYQHDFKGRTALHYLSASESKSIRELLRTITRRSCDSSSCCLKNYQAVLFYSNDNRRPSSYDGEDERTNSLHTSHSFINKTDDQGLTPLMIALNNHYDAKALILIENGANIHVK